MLPMCKLAELTKKLPGTAKALYRGTGPANGSALAPTKRTEQSCANAYASAYNPGSRGTGPTGAGNKPVGKPDDIHGNPDAEIQAPVPHLKQQEKFTCILPGQVLQGRIIGGSKARYTGQAVEVTTMSGATLAVTPNHPVMTEAGPVAAGNLQKGQYLLHYIGENKSAFAGDYEQYAPATVEEVFRTLKARAGEVFAAYERTAGLDFHGDALFFEGEIEVIGSYRQLRCDPVANSGQGVLQSLLMRRDAAQIALAGSSGSQFRFERPRRSSHCSVRCTGLSFSGRGIHARPYEATRFGPIANWNAAPLEPVANVVLGNADMHTELPQGGTILVEADQLGKVRACMAQKQCFGARTGRYTSPFEPVPNSGTVHPSANPELFCRDAGLIQADDLGKTRARVLFAAEPAYFGTGADLDGPSIKPGADGATTDPCAFTQLFKCCAGLICLDKIVKIRRYHYSGPVFDFESPLGWIIVNRLCISNCGPGALREIAEGAGADVSEKALAAEAESGKEKGTEPADMLTTAKKLGLAVRFHEGISVQQLMAILDTGHPVIVAMQAWGEPEEYHKLESGHYSVAVGHDNQNVFFADPAMEGDQRQYGRVPIPDFEGRWHDQEYNGRTYHHLAIEAWRPGAEPAPVAADGVEKVAAAKQAAFDWLLPAYEPPPYYDRPTMPQFFQDADIQAAQNTAQRAYGAAVDKINKLTAARCEQGNDQYKGFLPYQELLKWEETDPAYLAAKAEMTRVGQGFRGPERMVRERETAWEKQQESNVSANRDLRNSAISAYNQRPGVQVHGLLNHPLEHARDFATAPSDYITHQPWAAGAAVAGTAALGAGGYGIYRIFKNLAAKRKAAQQAQESVPAASPGPEKVADAQSATGLVGQTGGGTESGRTTQHDAYQVHGRRPSTLTGYTHLFGYNPVRDSYMHAMEHDTTGDMAAYATVTANPNEHWTPLPAGAAEITSLYTDPAHRRQGLARAVLDELHGLHTRRQLYVSPDPFKDRGVPRTDIEKIYRAAGYADAPDLPGFLYRAPPVPDPLLKEAEAAPGLPDRTAYPDPLQAFTPGQRYDYIVQQHLARKAGPHYDVRLGDPNGLHSWAVRKGLPGPGQKHLAVHQPIHDYDYKDFEGEIPEGSYGAGSVTKHDEGQILVTKITDNAIHFTTASSRFPERFVMTRPKNWEDKDWLLINTTPTTLSPYQKVHYKKIPAEQVDQFIDQMQEGDSLEAKVDGASSLIKLLEDGAEVTSYRAAKGTGQPIVHTERMFHGRPKFPVPPELVGSTFRGELYGTRNQDSLRDEQGVAGASSDGQRGLEATGEQQAALPAALPQHTGFSGRAALDRGDRSDTGIIGDNHGMQGRTVRSPLPGSAVAGDQGASPGAAGARADRVPDLPRGAVPAVGRCVIPAHELGGILNATVGNAIDKQRERGVRLRDMLFDITQYGNRPVGTDVPRAERRKMMESVLKYLPPEHFHMSPAANTKEEARALWGQIKNKQHPLTEEGVVMHPATGRPMKGKLLDESDVHITGVFPGEGKYKGVGAGGIEYALEPGGKTVGRVGTGLSDEFRRELWSDPGAYTGRVAKIRSQGQFASGAHRAPAYLSLHEDWAPPETELSKAAEAPVPLAPAPPLQEERIIERLKRIKALSDTKAYGAKHARLRELMLKNPQHWVIDSDVGRFYGVTHAPTGFQLHMPKTAVPDIIPRPIAAPATPAMAKLAGLFSMFKSPTAFIAGPGDDIALGALTMAGGNEPAPTLEQTPVQNKQLRKSVMQQYNVPGSQVYREAHYVNDYGADDVDRVEHIMDLEGRFGMHIPDDDAEQLHTVGDMEDYIDLHRQAPQPAPVLAKAARALRLHALLEKRAAPGPGQSFYLNAAQGYGNNLLYGRGSIYSPGEGIMGAVNRHAGAIQARGDRAIQEAGNWDKMQNAMNPNRSLTQMQGYLAGTRPPIVNHPLDRFMQGEPLDIIPRVTHGQVT